MASIWKCEGKTERKVARHDDPMIVRADFIARLDAARKAHRIVNLISGCEAMVTRKDGSRYLLFIELMAPPSAPETGQPIGAMGSVKAKDGKVYSVDVAAYAKTAS